MVGNKQEVDCHRNAVNELPVGGLVSRRAGVENHVMVANSLGGRSCVVHHLLQSHHLQIPFPLSHPVDTLHYPHHLQILLPSSSPSHHLLHLCYHQILLPSSSPSHTLHHLCYHQILLPSSPPSHHLLHVHHLQILLPVCYRYSSPQNRRVIGSCKLYSRGYLPMCPYLLSPRIQDIFYTYLGANLSQYLYYLVNMFALTNRNYTASSILLSPKSLGIRCVCEVL